MKGETKGIALREQYRVIAEERGYRWQDCRVLTFSFGSDRIPEKFHYALMLSGLAYILCDCYDRRAVIVIGPEGDADAVTKLAGKFE